MTAPVTTVADLLRAHAWKPIPGCPGRFRLVGGGALPPSAFVGEQVQVQVHRVESARDPVYIAVLPDGGIISYAQADGSFVHTLNTVEGFRRKLLALGIALPTP